MLRLQDGGRPDGDVLGLRAPLPPPLRGPDQDPARRSVVLPGVPTSQVSVACVVNRGVRRRETLLRKLKEENRRKQEDRQRKKDEEVRAKEEARRLREEKMSMRREEKLQLKQKVQ